MVHDLRVMIWTKKFNKDTRKISFEYLYTGNLTSNREIHLHYQEETGCYLLISDKSSYFKNYFVCKNRDQRCYYQFETKKQLEQHQILCCNEKVKIVQTEMGPKDVLIKKAQVAGIIPKTGKNRDFLFYDIESVLPKSSVKTKKTSVLSTHSLVSIAVNRYYL